MDSDHVRSYAISVDGETVEFVSNVDVKAKFWDAKKCSYPTFEIQDIMGNIYVFATKFVSVVHVKSDHGDS